jgi:hypothetical protein
MKTENLLAELEKFLESEEGQKSLEEFALKLEREEAHRDRWAIRLYNRIQEDIDGSIEKMTNWYYSDKYVRREYAKGYEPREKLLWTLLDAAEIYGEDCTPEEIEKYANMFTGNMKKIGSYVIQVMHGQGSVIKIDCVK